MGIPGLLQFIKEAAEPISIKKYKGQAVAVDTYCWLHKGAFSCAEKLAKGEPTDQYVWYCMKFVDMLLNFRVKPILVFDGRNLPSKQEVEKTRRERRTANLQKGRQLLRDGKVSEARDCFTRSVSITPAMAHSLIKAARARGVDCIVAPYEADAQLAYLTKCHLAQAVITEDSDLLAFGCKKVILKMDKQGNALEIDQKNFGRCRSLGNVFTEEKFRHMCILSGCDYLPSLHGIGLGKACKLLRLAKEPDILKVIRKMAQYLKMNLVVPEEYVEGFIRADNTFLYQLVFDPIRREVVPLNPYPDHISEDALSYAGRHFGEEIELQLAMGNLDLETLERIDDFNPDKSTRKVSKGKSQSWNESAAPTGPSIWSRDAARPSGPSTPPSLPLVRDGGVEGLRLPCRELQIKRAREESLPSDQDILLQYCGSKEKRLRAEQPTARPKPNPPTPTRKKPNHFATLLQRRNQDTEEEDDEDTCSRFFNTCSSGSSTTDKAKYGADPPAPSPLLPIQTSKTSGPVTCSQGTPSPPLSQNLTSPRTASQGFRLFDWPANFPSSEQSGTLEQVSGVIPQQHLQTNSSRSTRGWEPPRLSAAGPNTEASEDPPDSPLSQDSAYWSQSQPYKSPSDQKEDPVSQDHAASETSPLPQLRGAHAEEAEEKPKLLPSQGPGLPKSKASSQTRGLGPARVSGLRRPAGPHKKKCNNENRPGFQATISSLWKSFSFQKNASVMSPCQK